MKRPIVRRPGCQEESGRLVADRVVAFFDIVEAEAAAAIGGSLVEGRRTFKKFHLHAARANAGKNWRQSTMPSPKGHGVAFQAPDASLVQVKSSTVTALIFGMASRITTPAPEGPADSVAYPGSKS